MTGTYCTIARGLATQDELVLRTPSIELTEWDVGVLRERAGGRTVESIANRRSMSTRNVRRRLAKLYERTGVRSTEEAIAPRRALGSARRWRVMTQTRAQPRRGGVCVSERSWAGADGRIGAVAELRTERLLLRRWRAEDRAPFAALNADPEVMAHFPATLDRAESDALADRIDAQFTSDGYGLWAVEVPGVAPFIGFVGLAPIPFEAHFTPALEVGWRLARPHWGAGYATKAARAALEFAFEDLGSTRSSRSPSRRTPAAGR